MKPEPSAAAALVVAVIIATASSGVAVAERVGVVVYAPGDAPASAADTAGAVGAVIAERDGTPVEDPLAEARRRRGRGAVPIEELADFRRARELTEEGWRAYLAVEAEFAAARLAEARRTAVRVAHLPGGRELVADVSLRLGAVLIHLGRGAEAADALRLAARLDATRAVTVAQFAPEVVSAYEAASTARTTPVRLRVETDVPARLEVDGQDAGAAPATIEVEPGQHLIVVTAAGYRPAARILAVTGAASERVRLEPAPLEAALEGSGALAPGRSEAQAAVVLEAALTFAELDAVMLVGAVWRQGEPALVGQLCAGVPVRCTRTAEVRFAEPRGLAAAAEALWRSVTGEGSRPLPPTLVQDRRITTPEPRPGGAGGVTSEGCRWCRSGWLWIGVGTAALAAGAVILFTRDGDTGLDLSLDPCDFGGGCATGR